MGSETAFDLDVRGAGGELHLVRDLLDKQLVDRNHDPMGRVDGLVIGVAGQGPPQLLCIESGVTVAARRLGRAPGRWVRGASRRWGLRSGKPLRIPWSKVTRVGIETELELEAGQTPALAWEHWLLEHVVRYLPSIKPENTERPNRQSPGQQDPKQPREPSPAGSGIPALRSPSGYRRVRLQRLLGRKVFDSGGQLVGRVEEVRGWVRDGRCVVEEYILGGKAMLERLSVAGLSMGALRMLGARHGFAGRSIPWPRMDLADPDRPRLR